MAVLGGIVQRSAVVEPYCIHISAVCKQLIDNLSESVIAGLVLLKGSG